MYDAMRRMISRIISKVCTSADDFRPDGLFVPIAWPEAKRRARSWCHHQNRTCGPKVQRLSLNESRVHWRAWSEIGAFFDAEYLRSGSANGAREPCCSGCGGCSPGFVVANNAVQDRQQFSHTRHQRRSRLSSNCRVTGGFKTGTGSR
jgi:hypothetical protein